MGNSCSIIGHVKNSKGEVVESKLWNDLLHHLSDRGLTKEFYRVGTDEKFLDRVRDKAKFDENGQITFNSLRKLANIDIKQEKLLADLNKDISSGLMDYEKALGKLTDFNRNSQFNDEFMATIKKVGNQYELSVVPKNSANQAALEQEISNRTLRDRLMYHLNKAGVSVEFFENDDKENGRYSTVNARKTADGMYNLIRVAHGEKLTSALAEEAGHFAVASLGNSPLVERLTSLLTPDVQKKIFGDEYDSKVLGANSKRETAGHLVGKHLMEEVDTDTAWDRLASRIANLAKRVFYTIKGDDVMKDILEADNIAKRIARDFMSENPTGSIDNALEIRETLYSSTSSLNTRVFREVVNNLALTTSKLKAISGDALSAKVNAILGVAESGRMTAINAAPNTSLSDIMALDGIAEAMSMISDMIGQGKEINNLLDSVDFLNTADFYNNMADNGRKLRQVHTFVSASISLQRLVTEAIKILPGKESLVGDVENIQVTDSVGNIQTINLKEITRSLSEANEYLLAELVNKEKQFYLKFCESTLGSKYIYKASRVIWNMTKKKRNPEGKTKRLMVQKGGRVDLSSVLESMESDINLFERYLGSMSNNPDVIGQIADKATKMANMQADNLTNKAWDELRVLEARFKEIKGIEQRDLFEKFDDGTLTGNIISEFHWGEYERDWKAFKDVEFENFKNSIPNIDDLTEFEKALRWDNYFRPLAKVWHKNNSTWDNNEMRYVPNDQYRNYDFDNLMQSHNGLREWYNSYMQLKTDLDARLPEGSTLAVRMPQFKGTFTNIVKNQTVGKAKAIGSALRSKMRDTFCESSEDTDFGSDQTYNSEEEERFANNLAHEKENIHRLPLYGINKLQDMNELSTDILHSTLAYAGMANTYLAMNTLVDTLEVGKEVLSERRVGGDKSEKDRALTSKGTSRAYNRYLKFLDKQVYGVSSSKTVIFRGIVVEKVISAISSFASKYFLGGNVVGGSVNTMTGFNEVFKEAIGAEFFNLKDLKNANKLYFSSFGKNWWNYGKEFKEDRVNLFIRHFNALGESKTKQRDWYTQNSKARRIYNMFNESIFLPYKSGDHYMQSMAYLAIAQRTMLYDENGNSISLWQAYKVVDNKDTYGRKGGKTLELGGTFFKHKGAKREYDMINSILSQLENPASAGPFGAVIQLTQEQKDYLNNKGYNIADTENTIHSLKDDAYKLTWNIDDESAYMDKCREINNRMHGIYNNQDKVALQQNWFGNALLAMRGYALGMIERRYSSGHYSVALGQDVEGSITTLSKVIAAGFTDSMGFWKTMRAICLPMQWGKVARKTKLDLYRAGFSVNQIANLRRNFGDAMLISLLLLLKGLTAAGGDDDDDDEDNAAAGIIYYFANRLSREQQAYNTPTGLWTESTTITDLAPVGLSALVDLGKMAYQFGGLPFADEDDSNFYYQSSKEDRYEKGDAKAYVHFWRMFPYLRSVYTFEQPYEAAKSFDYGQNMRAR